MPNTKQTSPLPIIWVLEPDDESRSAYRDCLTDYELVEFTSMTSLNERIGQNKPPNLVIADTDLDDGNIVDQWPVLKIECPFILSSSSDNRALIERGFAQGCSDFLMKPISRNELLVKVERVIGNQRLATNSITTDMSKLRVHKGGDFVALTPKEMQIVTLLMKGPRTRDDITINIWEGTNVSRKAFDVHLFHLRRKLVKLGITILREKNGYYSIKG